MSPRSNNLEKNFRSYGHIYDGNWNDFSSKNDGKSCQVPGRKIRVLFPLIKSLLPKPAKPG